MGKHAAHALLKVIMLVESIVWIERIGNPLADSHRGTSAVHSRSTLEAREKSAGAMKAWKSDLNVRHPAGGPVWLIWQT